MGNTLWEFHRFSAQSGSEEILNYDNRFFLTLWHVQLFLIFIRFQSCSIVFNRFRRIRVIFIITSIRRGALKPSGRVRVRLVSMFFHFRHALRLRHRSSVSNLGHEEIDGVDICRHNPVRCRVRMDTAIDAFLRVTYRAALRSVGQQAVHFARPAVAINRRRNLLY